MYAKKDALKFEAGSKQVLEITALGASVDLILQTGVKTIEAEVKRLSSLLAEGLRERSFDVHYNGSAHVNFVPKKDTAERLRALPCLFAMRGPGIRLSPHAFNSDEQINRVLNALV